MSAIGPIISPTYHPRTYALAVQDTPGLVSYWRLGERSGTTAIDQQGLNNGTYVNTPTLGVAGLLVSDVNAAVTFTKASSQSITLASTNGFPSGATPRTLSFMCSQNSANNQAILFTGTLVATQLFYIYITSAGLLSSYSGTAGVDISSGSLKTGTTKHVIAVYDGASWTTCVDGVSQSPVAQTLNTVYGGVTPEIAHEGSTLYFDGTLDEVALWNRALSPAERSLLYRVSLGL